MIENFDCKNNKLYFESFKAQWCLSLCDDRTFRLQSAENGTADDFGAAQQLAFDLKENRDFKVLPFSVQSTDNSVIAVSSCGDKCIITENDVTFTDKSGTLKEKIVFSSHFANKEKIVLATDESKKYFGTGERFDCVNQYGKKLDIYAVDKWCQIHGNSYCPIPFVITSDNTGIFLNRYEHQVFDIGKTEKDKFTLTVSGAPIDLYVFLSDTPQEILTSYSKLTGFAPVPADWMFGTQVCRYSPDFTTPEGVLLMAQKMEENNLPWEAVIIEGWRTYDSSRYDELKELSRKIHSLGKKLMVYEGCGRIHPPFHEKFDITDGDAVHDGECAEIEETYSYNLADHAKTRTMRAIDYTNPAAWEKWQKMWDTLIFDIGVDGAKIDFCEQFPDFGDVNFYDGRSPKGMHHRYPTVYNTLMHRHFNEKESGGMNFSRGGGIGAQRYPFLWAGDQRREYKFLKAVLNAVLSIGFSGVPFLSWDAAGYRLSFNAYDLAHEKNVFIRGIEFAAFSANIQTHGKVKRPYDFDEKTISVYRKYAVMHDLLRPYLTESAKECSETGIPLMKHLYFYDSADRKCAETDDEYMLGNSLLVAPVLSRSNSRNIYLPKGEWKNIFTNETFTGPVTLEKQRIALDEIPVFRLMETDSKTLDGVLQKIKELVV